MAQWRELTPDDEEEVQDAPPEQGGFALPVPQDPEMSQLKESLFGEVKSAIQSDPDERFARLRFGPRGAQGGAGGALPEETVPTEWRELEAPPPIAKEPEPDSLWQKAINFTSRSIIEQAAGGAREFGQRMAFEEASERGEEFAQLQKLKGAPEGEAAYFGPQSIGEMFRSPFEAMNLGENLIKMGLSATEEGRVVLEKKLLEQAQEKLDRAKELGEGAEDRPFSKATQQFLNPESENAAWDDFMADPFTIVAELGTRSLPNMAPGLALGIAGGAAAGQPGFVAGLGAGSARVEYASTLLGELQKQNIDIYNAEQLFGVVSNAELMDEIHQKAATRAATIGTLDGIAGLVGATQLTGPVKNAVVRRFTEVVAQTGTQGGLGGLGEALAMTQTGEAESLGEAFQSRDVLAEIAGEAVTAPIEVAGATIAGVRDTVGGDVKVDDGKPTQGGTTTPIPSTDIDPETGKPVIREDVAAETETFETPQEGFSDAERAALESALDNQAEAPAQGTLDLPPSPAPTPETATTPPAETAPVAAGPEPTTPMSSRQKTSQVGATGIDPTTTLPPGVAAPVAAEPVVAPPVDEVVTDDDLVTEPTPVEEAAPGVENPMIQKKEIEAGVRELNKRTKDGMPGIRKAFRELGTAITAVFPDSVALPSLKGTIGPKRIGEFFAALDEEIKIDEALPNLKGFLDAVLASPDAASAVQNIGRLKDYVSNNAQVIETAQDPFLEQANQGVAAFDSFEGKRKEKRAQATRLADRAVAVDELATTVKALTEEATNRGVEVPADINETVRRARSYRESSQTTKPRTLKGGAGATVTPQKFSGKNLDEVGGKLREAATSIATALAAVDETKPKQKPTTPKKTDAKPKVKKTSPVTEQPAKPKKPTKKEKESARVKAEMEKGQAELAAAMPGAAKLIKVQGDTSSPNVVPPAKLSEADVVTGLLGMDPATLSYNNLRRVAKHLGVKAVGKKADILTAVQEWGDKATEAVDALDPMVGKESREEIRAEQAAPKVTVKKTRKVANPEKVIEVSATPISGKQSAKVVSELGFDEGTSLDEAFDEAGISKKAAATIKALINKANAEGKKKILAAIARYSGPEDNLSLVATIEEALKGKVANAAMMDVLQFVEGMALKRMGLQDPNAQAADMDLAEEAAEQGMSLEDYKFVLQETGQFVEEDPAEANPWSDEYFDMSADEYANSQNMEEDTMPKGAAQSGQELFRALVNAKTGLLGFISQFTKQRGLHDPGPTNVNDMLKAIIKSLPSNNRYVPLAKRLLELDLQVPVFIYGERMKGEGAKTLGSYYPGNNYDAADRKIKLFLDDETDPRHVFSTVLHEIVHAATVAGYHTDAKFRSDIDSLYDRAVLEMDREFPGWKDEGATTTSTFYGMTNPKEFIAEALTNPKFQQWLAGIDSTRTFDEQMVNRPGITGLMRLFVNRIKKYLGYSIRNSLLEDVILLVDDNLSTENEVLIQQQTQQVTAMRAATDFKPATEFKKETRDQVLDAQRNIKTGIKGVATKIKELSVQGGRRVNLGFSNRDVIERNFRPLFDTAATAMDMANPLTAYTKAKNSASSLARKYERMGFLMLKKLQALTNSARSELGTHMRDITKANIDPTQPLNSAANAHIWTKKGKIRKAFKDIAPQARSNYLDFKESNPEAAKILGEMAQLTKQIHDTKVKSAMFALGEAFEFDAATTAKLQQAKVPADIDAIIDPTEVEVAQANVDNPTGDLFKGKKENKKDLKRALNEAGARAEAAKAAKKILVDSSIKGWYFPLRRYGDFIVSSGPDVKAADRYVSFHSTQAEADKVAAALNEQAAEGGDKVSVSLKLRKSASAGDVKSVIADLTSRIKDKPTRARLKGAMAEVLASNAAYQSQLKRANVDGVASDDMARAFEEYVHVSKYTIGDLLVSHKVSTAIRDLNTIAKNEDGQFDSDTAVEIGQVVDEIKKQNITDVTDREMSTIQKTVGMVGFLNFLGAPSYWMLNATQTYTVTIPYVTAKFGVKAPLRLAAAQKQVLEAATKALTGKDKSYEGFKAVLPPAARRVVEALEAEGVIQSTIAHEFGDMLSPTALNKMREHALLAPVAKTTNLAMQVMEKVPEAVEHFNRISTALAIYEMSGGDITATIDGVQATQFNYDTGNRARLLKNLPGVTSGTTKQYVTPIMMFKTYGIGIARLFYGAMLDVAFKKGGRTEAMKLAAGLITTHTFFGGVAGGLMMAPVMAIQAAANAMFKEPDDEWDLEEGLEMWGNELAGDWFGTMVRRGVPTALGVDMSRSVNLGNLIWMSNDNLDPAKYGDIEKGIFQLAGPVAQYGVTAYREGYRLVTGNNDGSTAEFLEAAIPLKLYRGVSQAVRYNLEGIETGSGLNMLSPEEFNATLQTALGFQSVDKTSTQGEYYDDVRLEQKRADRKLQLMERANEAALAGKTGELADIMDDIMSYNLSVPKAQYRITAGEMARLRSRRRSTQREYDKKYRYSN